MDKEVSIAIIDCGSQYTLVISRTLRELGYRSIVLSPKNSDNWLSSHTPRAIIVSGGDKSVTDADAPHIPESILTRGVPLLGICYGMQWLAHKLGGRVGSDPAKKEYGPITITHTGGPLYADVPETFSAWASHGDSVLETPPGFTEHAQGESGALEAMMCDERKMYAFQYHPEVHDTPEGSIMLQNFLNIVGLAKDWNPELAIQEIRDEVGKLFDGNDKKAVIGISGGVDSTTLAAILSPVMQGSLFGFTIDHGALREGEIDMIRESAKAAGIVHTIVDAKEEFIAAIGATIDAEEKRKVFKTLYQKHLEKYAQEIGAEFIMQGSLATDFIESGKAGESALIKSHHNIGIDWALTDVHPLRKLFKYEVRELAAIVGLPPEITKRQPFPGPALFIRIVGTPVDNEKMELLRQADATVRGIVRERGIEGDISQLVVGLLGVKTVGVKGVAREYGYSIVVRGVETSDFMTARGYYFSKEVAEEIVSVVTKQKGVTRVFFDPTPKPPGTTEFE